MRRHGSPSPSHRSVSLESRTTGGVDARVHAEETWRTDGVNLSTVQENEEQNLDSRDYFDLIKEESTGHCD